MSTRPRCDEGCRVCLLGHSTHACRDGHGVSDDGGCLRDERHPCFPTSKTSSRYLTSTRPSTSSSADKMRYDPVRRQIGDDNNRRIEHMRRIVLASATILALALPALGQSEEMTVERLTRPGNRTVFV